MSKLRWMKLPIIVLVGLLVCIGCADGSLNGSPRGVSAGATVSTLTLAPTIIVLQPTATPDLDPTATATTIATTPEITAFSAMTTSDIAGDSIVLKWEAVGDQATLCPIIDAHWVSCRCLFDVPLIGSQVIAPQDIVGRYSAFELAADAADLRITRTVTLNVSCSPGTPSWFFADPPQMCPDELALHSLAAAQRFEHGLMIWLAEQDTYYILYDHLLPPSGGTVVSATITSLQIVHGPLDLEPGASPVNRGWEDSPAGYIEPVSGFGLVWQGEMQGIEDVREQLGCAIAAEVGYVSTYQCEPACGSHRNCYLLGPNGTVFYLSYNAHLGYVWRVWGQMEE